MQATVQTDHSLDSAFTSKSPKFNLPADCFEPTEISWSLFLVIQTACIRTAARARYLSKQYRDICSGSIFISWLSKHVAKFSSQLPEDLDPT